MKAIVSFRLLRRFFLPAVAGMAVLLLLLPRPLISAVCDCGNGNGRIFLKTIVCDGTMADWNSVRGDQDNVVCDGPDVNGLGAPWPDLDVPGQARMDLTQFVFTWDASYLFFFTRRVAGGTTPQDFLYYADLDNDGHMSATDRVINARWQGNTRNVQISLFNYSPVRPGIGDSMVSASGLGDGWTLPGTIATQVALEAGNWGAVGGTSMEFRVRWTDLGIPPGTAVGFHISSALNTGVPGSVQDNMGGCGGGAGTIQFADLLFSPDRALSGDRGQTLYAFHVIVNTGNGSDSFDVSSAVAGSYTPAVAYLNDVNGNGVFDSGVDILLTDTNGNGTPDTGALAAGATFSLLIRYVIGLTGPASPRGTATVTTTARSFFDPVIFKTVTDIVAINKSMSLTVTKTSQVLTDPYNLAVDPKRVPGSFIQCTVTTANLGDGAADNDSTYVSDPVPAGTALFVGDLGAPGSGPVAFLDGADASGLAYAYGGLGSAADDLEFSNNGAITYSYTPVPGAYGCDPAVTHLRVRPRGVFSGSNGTTTPAFGLRWKVRVR